MPSLSSFVNSSQYTKENLSFPFIAAMKLGTGYATPTFTGINQAASNDPGGLFGWLIYARTTFYSPARGTTSDSYIVYTSPTDLIGDLNQLGGVTSCLVSATGAGGTFGFFQYIGVSNNVGQLAALSTGVQFLHAINYMAYGGSLVIAGNVAGFNQYIADTENKFDIVIDPDHSSSVAQWLLTQPSTIGIYPSIAGSDGITGSGYTMANFQTLFGSASFLTGITSGKRVFNVCGVKAISNLNTSQLQADTQITYKISAANDVGGFFARAKNRNELYLTVAGLDRSTVLNGNIINPIDWSSSLKTTFRNNKVNFFVNYNPKFLGSDLVGATYSTSVTVNDRVGPATMRANITKAIDAVALKYVFQINNKTTRDQVITEVQTALDQFAAYLDTTQTQITCDSSNNTDGGTSLNIDVVVKPILATESFLINFSYTQ